MLGGIRHGTHTPQGWASGDFNRSDLCSIYDNSKMTSSKDSLFKVRPLLNTVKITFSKYLNIGSEVSLDVASRSKYGGFSIFLNPTKPGGKYHFRFYMLCCATKYACFGLRMHTKDVSVWCRPYHERAQGTILHKIHTYTLPPDYKEEIVRRQITL